jgi:hypothetical protein
VEVGNGNYFLFGVYFEENETFRCIHS